MYLRIVASCVVIVFVARVVSSKDEPGYVLYGDNVTPNLHAQNTPVLSCHCLLPNTDTPTASFMTLCESTCDAGIFGIRVVRRADANDGHALVKNQCTAVCCSVKVSVSCGNNAFP